MSFRNRQLSKQKVIFSKKVDDRISGITLGLTFVIIGILLLSCPNYFGNEEIRGYFVWSFIVVGFIGLFMEADKGKTIQGFTNIAVGAVFLLIWFLLYRCGVAMNFILALISLLLLLIGVYTNVLGIIRVGYSIWANILTAGKEGEKSGWSDLILFLTKIASLILVLVQIAKAFLD